jgi:hypothetical protein
MFSIGYIAVIFMTITVTTVLLLVINKTKEPHVKVDNKQL